MTCIVGLVDNCGVHIGADSAATIGTSSRIRRDPKVFRNGGFLIGFTTSYRMGQLLACALMPPTRREGQEILSFMAVDFVDAVRSCLKAGGCARKDNEIEACGTFLVGFEGHLFRIESDYQVAWNEGAFDACGCGEEYALGAMFNTAHLPAKERLTQALVTAERFNCNVRGPFRVLSL